MSKAAFAPKSSYNRSYWISTKALSSFKDIIERNSLSKFMHRTGDGDLANMLDYAVYTGASIGKEQAFSDSEGSFWVVDVTDTLETSVVALLRKSTNTAPGIPAKTVVVLLDREYAEKRKSLGFWKQDGEKSSSTATIGDKVGTMKVELAATVTSTTPSAPVPTQVVASAPLPRDATETYLVRWRNAGESAWNQAEYLRTEATSRLSALGSDSRIDATSIEVWKRVKAKVQVSIDD